VSVWTCKQILWIGRGVFAMCTYIPTHMHLDREAGGADGGDGAAPKVGRELGRLFSFHRCRVAWAGETHTHEFICIRIHGNMYLQRR
jgi:hypothetical protein